MSDEIKIMYQYKNCVVTAITYSNNAMTRL